MRQWKEKKRAKPPDTKCECANTQAVGDIVHKMSSSLMCVTDNDTLANSEDGAAPSIFILRLPTWLSLEGVQNA